MKKNISLTVILALFLTLSAVTVSAQKNNGFIPEKGSWQLVSNLHDKKTIIVQFYSDEGNLMYEETLTNAKLNLNRKKVRRELYFALKEAYQTWALVHTPIEAKNLIAKRL